MVRARDDRSRERLAEGRRQLRAGQKTEAEGSLRLAAGTGSHTARAEAGEALAWLLIDDGCVDEALAVAGRIRPDLADPSTLCPVLDLPEGRSAEEAAAAIVGWWLRHPGDHIGSLMVLEIDRQDLVLPFLELLLSDPVTHAVELAAAVQASLHLGGRYNSAIDGGARLLRDPRASATVSLHHRVQHGSNGALRAGARLADRAVESGWHDVDQLLADEDLTTLRTLPRFG